MSFLDAFLAEHGLVAVAGAALVLFVGGLAKGALGFALPLIAISGLGAFLPAPTAVALLIMPTLVTNVWQGLRDGLGPAAATLREHRLILATLLPTIVLSAQLLAILPDSAIFAILGAAITLFSISQLVGVRFPDPTGAPPVVPLGVGVVAGLFGGLAGIWGPPVMMYMIARNTLKDEQMRALGLVFVLGSVALALAHSASGLFDAATAAVSAAGVIPVAVGMACGLVVNRRMNQTAFRRATLVVLALSGLNLLRRAFLV